MRARRRCPTSPRVCVARAMRGRAACAPRVRGGAEWRTIECRRNDADGGRRRQRREERTSIAPVRLLPVQRRWRRARERSGIRVQPRGGCPRRGRRPLPLGGAIRASVAMSGERSSVGTDAERQPRRAHLHGGQRQSQRLERRQFTRLAQVLGERRSKRVERPPFPWTALPAICCRAPSVQPQKLGQDACRRRRRGSRRRSPRRRRGRGRSSPAQATSPGSAHPEREPEMGAQIFVDHQGRALAADAAAPRRRAARSPPTMPTARRRGRGRRSTDVENAAAARWYVESSPWAARCAARPVR